MTAPLLRYAATMPCAALALAACLGGCERPQDHPRVPPPKPVTSAPALPPAPPPIDTSYYPIARKVPPFPYLELPRKAAGQHQREAGSERSWVVAGRTLVPVQGRVSERYFAPPAPRMSADDAFRSYDAAIKAMGGIRVDLEHPMSRGFVTHNGGSAQAILDKLRIPNLAEHIPGDTPTFSQYLLRTESGKIWIRFFIFDDQHSVGLVAVEEQAAAARSVAAAPP